MRISTKCPKCGSDHTHRSRLLAGERAVFKQPRRCHTCKTRYWAPSLAAYLGAASLAVFVALISGIVWLVLHLDRGEQSWAGTPVPAELAAPSTGAPADPTAQALPAEGEKGAVAALPEGEAKAKDSAVGDTVVTVNWYKSNADKGDLDAQYKLGLLHLTGKGALQDFAEAAKWLRSAADRGHPQSQYQLGMMYRAGHGVGQDFARSYMWLNLAAASGVNEAVAARDNVMRALNPQQLAEAQKAARDWLLKPTEPRPAPTVGADNPPVGGDNPPAAVESTSQTPAMKAMLSGQTVEASKN